MSDEARDRDPPHDCASPPCLMHEIDPAYMGLAPETLRAAARCSRPVDEGQRPDGDGGSSSDAAEVSRKSTARSSGNGRKPIS